MDELNDGDAERPEADTHPMGEFGSQLGATGLGQAFAHMGVARAGVPWTTVLPEPGWLQKVGAGLNPSNAIGAALDRLQQRTFDLAPVIGIANEIGSTVSARLTAIGEPFRKMAEDMAVIAKSFERYPDEMREGLIAMNQYGWYLDLQMGMSKPLRFKRALDDGRQEDAEVEMVKHFEKRTASIRAELIQAYPHRREVLDAAFDAHLNGQHFVSIPVLLAQVDGICFDVANAHFFMGNERPKVLAYATELAGTELARAFLAPLESGMTVAMSEKARPQGFSRLNRHMVLHGESIDYGTKENGLRAISLLNYIAQSLQRELSAPDESVAETEWMPMPPIDS
ncbi:hypothetical protein [Burkholderia ubonensis]|uniref:hypothetical protein n=1 Tax=Burkholderia ubonensis TaxID=101571 RepID=UPI000A7AC2BE|nr:hypothetical protein [Burkholderia ubonensis]